LVQFAQVMTTATRERRAPHPNPFDASAAAFAERHVDFSHARLRRLWTTCPECGDNRLQHPSGADRKRIPEAAGVCGGCGVAFMATLDGRVRALTPRHV